VWGNEAPAPDYVPPDMAQAHQGERVVSELVPALVAATYAATQPLNPGKSQFDAERDMPAFLRKKPENT
jgi:hypothetical protein